MARQIGIDELEDLALGAALLGTGGGGDPHIGKLMAQQAIKEHGPVTLLDPSEVPDDALVVPVAMMGAPSVFVEKIPNGDEALHSLQRLEDYLGRKAFAVMPIECGGLNSTIPFVVAAKSGLPIVDADGMGRAFPELQMETFNVYGVHGTPMVITDEKKNWSILNTNDNKTLEYISRGITIRMGGVSYISLYPMTGAQVKSTSVLNTTTLGIDLGNTIFSARKKSISPLEQMSTVLRKSSYGEPIILFEGKVLDVNRNVIEGFTKGSVTLEGTGPDTGDLFKADFQNENLIVFHNDNVIATVPDLITFIDMETFKPITTETLRYGFRVYCLSIPTPPIMRTKEALDIWGPKSFGYNLPFIPVEERVKSLKEDEIYG